MYFNSEVKEAKWADSSEPYLVHDAGDTIRIHGYLAVPEGSGPFPAIVVGHGHRGDGSAELAKILSSSLNYVVLSIDGPNAGKSTGGPQDTEQAWISVEEVMNQPSPEVGFLYHYAYAGMRALTLLEHLSEAIVPPFLSPVPIDRSKLGVAGASMGGQFTYYINGVDDRVKGAIAIAVAGDWLNVMAYEGAWLYHGLYYYTRDGLKSGKDALNTVTDICIDLTAQTFYRYFDPIKYAPTQHGPLLTIIGSHDQYFTLPAINTTYNKIASAGIDDPDDRFMKRILIVPNGKHEVIDGDTMILEQLDPTIRNWLDYSFNNSSSPVQTPSVMMEVQDEKMNFKVVSSQQNQILHVNLHYATQIDTFNEKACDFANIELLPVGNSEYQGSVPLGTNPFNPLCDSSGSSDSPPAYPGNTLYFATVTDFAGSTISSKMYYQNEEMEFGSDFVPLIEPFPRDCDDCPTQKAPPPCLLSLIDLLNGRVLLPSIWMPEIAEQIMQLNSFPELQLSSIGKDSASLR